MSSEALSTTEASSHSSKRVPGRPKKSPVWDYFEYDSTQDKSVCQVEQPSTESLCGRIISGKYPTNLKQHLRLAHPNVMKEVLKKEEQERKLKLKWGDDGKRGTPLKCSRKSTLKESLNGQTEYDKDSIKYRTITRKLAIFVASSNVTNSIVENSEFKDLLHTMDPCYPVPERSSFQKELKEVMTKLKIKARDAMPV